jgi:hypothetical protein
MVSVADIPEALPDRFINRDRLEEIKSRIQRLPAGEYSHIGGQIICEYPSTPGRSVSREIALVDYLGALDAFLNMKSDMEALIRHVENADIENDKLLERLKAVSDAISEGRLIQKG